MIKFGHFSPAIVIILLVLTIGTWSMVYADIGNSELAVEKEEIENLVKSYFEFRYRSLSSLRLEEFTDIANEFTKSDPLLLSEFDKLEVEIAHAKQYHLRYSQYKYFLDFKEISIDPQALMATVSVIEGHDLVFGISEEISKISPITSSMRNLQHTIIMRKEQGEWKIISDQYNDYLWRLIRATGLSKDELLRSSNEPQQSIINSGVQQISTTCSLPSDESMHNYTRNGAVAYAQQWATAPRPYNHPPYDDYTDLGGDCTNFVSQAIHEGGNAAMVFGGSHGVGQPGWYYYSVNDRATAWNDVLTLHNFITQYWVWPAGPEGCVVLQYQAYEGDLIQYDWTNNSSWDHSVIIVRSQDYGQNNRYHWIAGHTPDTYDYPFTNYIYAYPNMIYRFTHIERIDGFTMIYLPLIKKNSNGFANQTIVPNLNPYPGPIVPTPYPAP